MNHALFFQLCIVSQKGKLVPVYLYIKKNKPRIKNDSAKMFDLQDITKEGEF